MVVGVGKGRFHHHIGKRASTSLFLDQSTEQPERPDRMIPNTLPYDAVNDLSRMVPSKLNCGVSVRQWVVHYCSTALHCTSLPFK
jgi:hypothetical protein